MRKNPVKKRKVAPQAKPITIKPRFDIADDVYVVNGNQIVPGTVSSRMFYDSGIENEDGSLDIEIQYRIYTEGVHIKRFEPSVFESVEAALHFLERTAVR